MEVKHAVLHITGGIFMVAAAFGPIYLPVFILVAWGAAVLLMKRRTVLDSYPDAEIEGIVVRIVDKKGHCGRILDMVRGAVNADTKLGRALISAIERYEASGNADDICCEETARSSRFAMMLRDSVRRNDSAMFICEAKRFGDEMREEDTLYLKSHGAISNSSFITGMGAAFFFPIFAGIGINVIRFSNSGIPEGWYEAVMLTAICYIIFANYIGQYRKESKVKSSMYASLFAIVGITALRLSATLAGAMI